MEAPRVASLLPGWTETVIALGGLNRLVGITHECTPPSDSFMPVVHTLTRGKFDSAQMASNEIAAVHNASTRNIALASMFASQYHDTHIHNLVEFNLCSFYHIDLLALTIASPNVILTQVELGNGAVTLEEIEQAVRLVLGNPAVQVLSYNPSTLTEIYAATIQIAKACQLDGQILVSATKKVLREQRESYMSQAECINREHYWSMKSCSVVQWLDPLYMAGGWIPEIIYQVLGVEDCSCRPGGPSVQTTWQELECKAPDFLFIAPCAMDLSQTKNEVNRIKRDDAKDIERVLQRSLTVCFDATRLFSLASCVTVMDTASTLVEAVVSSLSTSNSVRIRGTHWECYSKARVTELAK